MYYKNEKDLQLITEVRITKQAIKDLRKTPLYIQQKLRAWIVAVSKSGIIETRKRPGWHDEPLKGIRNGQRAIRLNKQWRAIYVVNKNGKIEFIEIQEITPHEY